jgi:CheY-like chemotaxis protein
MIILLAASGATETTKLRALIVEDDTQSRESMVKIFKMLGIETISAASVSEGLLALDQLPQALVLDLMLPDGNGIQILKHIREKQLPIRVAILTGADKPMIADAQRWNPDVLFTKPVDLPKLLSWLKAA